MKKLIIYSLVVLAAFGCEDYLDVNTDPNNPSEVTPALTLPVAQNYTARWMQLDRGVNHLGNMIMYNWSESHGYSWYNDEFLYLVTSTFYDQTFDNAYAAALKQYDDIENLDAETYPAYIGIAKIMKAYTYQILVDFYGDIPYSEALDRGDNTSPKYDDGEAIYDSLMNELTAAISLIEEAEVGEFVENPSSDDIMFGGDLTQWKQFANTMKIRILNRGKETFDVAAEIAIINAEGSGYITENVTVNPGYLDEVGKQNPFWASFGEDANGSAVMTGLATSATDYIIQYLQDRDDPRIDRLFEEPADGHRGVPQGIVAEATLHAPALVSNIGPGLLSSATQDAVIFTLAEHYFNMAELALDGSVGGAPEDYYEQGVTASFTSLGLTAAQASTYLSQNTTFENIEYNGLESIITQKWLAVNGYTAEQSWFDWVRTGYPENLPVSQEADGLVRPVRLAYPASELGANGPNVPDQPNVYTNKIFWAN